jgi:DNA-directed RNA polymerase subunit RPC12/RpoP
MTIQQTRKRIERLEEAQAAVIDPNSRERRMAEYNDRYYNAVISMLNSMPEDSTRLVLDDIRQQIDETGCWDNPYRDVRPVPMTTPAGASTMLCRIIQRWAHMAARKEILPQELTIPESVCRYLEQYDPNDYWHDDYRCIDCGQVVLGCKHPDQERSDPFMNCPVCGGPTLGYRYRQAILKALEEEPTETADAIKQEMRDRRRNQWPVDACFRPKHEHPASPLYQRVVGKAMAQYDGWNSHS